MKNGMRPVHPGEALHEDYMKPLGLSPTTLAKALNVSVGRINAVLMGRRMSADMALRLTRYFGGTSDDAKGWLNMQATYDLKMAEQTLGQYIDMEVKPRVPDR